MRCYLFDIDGTLADLSHRLHHIQKEPKDWDAFFAACPDDVVIRHMRKLLDDLSESDAVTVYVSGRSDRCREATEEWLEYNNFTPGTIYMRTDGDHRPDHEVKSDLLDRILADGFKPIMVFEDRTSVVAMWRARGIPCAQVADGNF